MLHQTISLWEQDQYHIEDSSEFQPTLVTYVLEDSKQRGVVLICSGGGYERLSPREAEPVALETDEGRGQDAHISGWMKLCTEWLQYTFGSSMDKN